MLAGVEVTGDGRCPMISPDNLLAEGGRPMHAALCGVLGGALSSTQSSNSPDLS